MSSLISTIGAHLRRLPAALSRAFDRGAAFVRWLLSAILDTARRTFARVDLSLAGGSSLLVILICVAIAVRLQQQRG